MGGASAVAGVGRGGGEGPAAALQADFVARLAPFRRFPPLSEREFHPATGEQNRTRRRPVGPVRFNFVSRGRLNAARLCGGNWGREVAIGN